MARVANQEPPRHVPKSPEPPGPKHVSKAQEAPCDVCLSLMVMMRTVLIAVFAIVLTYTRHLWHVPFDLINGKPIRIDLPVPYLQIDVVLVNKPEQIKAGP